MPLLLIIDEKMPRWYRPLGVLSVAAGSWLLYAGGRGDVVPGLATVGAGVLLFFYWHLMVGIKRRLIVAIDPRPLEELAAASAAVLKRRAARDQAAGAAPPPAASPTT